MAYSPIDQTPIATNKPVRRSFGINVAENFDAISAYGSVTPMGGSPTTGVMASGWSRVPGYLPFRMNRTLASGWTRQAVVLTRTLTSGSAVNWRVKDDGGNVVVTGTSHTSPNWTEEFKDIMPLANGRRHYLEINATSAAYTVQGYGVVEQYKE